MKITYTQVKALDPCYEESKLRKLLPDGEHIITIEKLLKLPTSDSRWLVARLLSKSNRIIWARACADRAKKYAADAAADAAYAAYAAAYAAEHKLAMEHAIELLG